MSRRKHDDETDGAGAEGDAVQPIYKGETLGETLAELRGEMKTIAGIVSQPVPPMSPEQCRRAEAWRGLVDIGREIARGEKGNRLVRDNADLLKQPYVDELLATVGPNGEGQPAPPVSPARPPAVAAPLLQSGEPEDPGATASHASPRQDFQEPSGEDAEALEDDDDIVPGYDLDRRFVKRRPSRLPKFTRMAERYFAAYETRAGKDNKDVKTGRTRCAIFVELIGDHPVDTYNGTDLQAYINLLKFWPGDNNKRPEDWSARQIIDDNLDLHLQPLAFNTMQDGYLTIVKRVIRWEMTIRQYSDPFAGVRLFYPATAAPPKRAQPLSADKLSRIFREGVASGLLDEAILPLIGHLTGRRIGLLVHLTGKDVREKYPGVWVAQTDGVVMIEGGWSRVPYKTEASTTFFVLHDVLREIGFVEWATSKGDEFLFPQQMKQADPSKSASQSMQRLWKRAGIESGQGEVFHSLRGGQIEDMRDAGVDARDRKLQAGHSVGRDEHDRYGFMSVTERRARELAKIELNPEIDFTVYHGLDFEKMHRARRIVGKRRKY